MTSRITRVGIDVDGVLRDFPQQVINMAQREGVHIPQPKKYEFLDQEINGESIRSKIWKSEEWLDEVFTEAPLMEKAKLGYDRFCADPNFQVYIVTAQRKGTEKYTEEWLKRNGFNQHFNTVFTFKKVSAPCQVLIDDYPNHIKAYRNVSRMGILVDHTYNQDFVHPLRVDNLFEAYKLLSEEKVEELV